MKWLEREAFPNCLISEDNRIIKTNSINCLPFKLQFSFPQGFKKEEYKAEITQRVLYSDPYDNNHKNDFIALTIESEDRKTVIKEKMLTKFLQKSSVLYLGTSESPILIQNKNYCVVIAPCNYGKALKYLPLN